MPVVTVDPSAVERFELSTAPADPNDPSDENGWVKLRALPYGMKLTRRDKAAKLISRQDAKDVVTELESANEWAVAFDFAYCIVDHNLTDQNKQKLDFTKPMSLKLLNPKVGSEIEKLINSLNEDEDEMMLEDFLSSPNISSSAESNGSSNEAELSSETQKATQ